MIVATALVIVRSSRSFPEEGLRILERRGIPYRAIIAHRGASTVAPESTELAYARAIAMGADYLEADLRRTIDGRIVVHHDSDMRRTSNVDEVFPDRRRESLGRFTLAELRQLDMGSWFNRDHPLRSREQNENLPILTLERLIDIVERSGTSVGLVLEFKDPILYPGIEEQVVKILADRGWVDGSGEPIRRGSLIFFSFNLESLKRLRTAAPSVPRVFLISGEMITWMRWRRWLRRAHGVADGIGARGVIAWPWYIAGAHDRGLFVLPYVVNEAWQLRLLTEYRADGFITDRPAFLRSFVDNLIASDGD
ncbi:MAG: glycerophosphodiester phosphodiesterase family protein [Alkalispirochaeta sp.]